MKKNIAIISCLVLVTIGGFALLGNKKSTSNSAVEGATTTTQTQAINSTANAQQSTETTKGYTAIDVASHNNKNDCWTIINNEVYNITSYVPMHPGGVAQITRICGKDGTVLFSNVPQHDNQATNQLAKLKIGSLN